MDKKTEYKAKRIIALYVKHDKIEKAEQSARYYDLLSWFADFICVLYGYPADLVFNFEG